MIATTEAGASMQARWLLPSPDPDFEAVTTNRIRTMLECPEPIARLLAGRHIDDPERFLNPSLGDLHAPSLMLGMAAAVARIQRAVTLGEPILIYGDYDVDGTTATVILKTAIERIASPERPAKVSYHVPHRLREGYGIQNVRLAEAAADGIRLVLSVDTGIRAFAAAAEAKALQLDLIVTDHHLPDDAEGLPEALAVINPAQPACPYPNKHLCGAGVAFKLAHALLAAHAATDAQRQRLETVILPSFLKLVAIATIADSVELTGENRAIVWLGLRELAKPVQPGLRALMQVAKLPLDTAPTAAEIGFRIAPRINAAGRMDVASDVVELFLTRDSRRAQELAAKLNTLNEHRRSSEAAALEVIEAQLGSLRDAAGQYPPECLVLHHPGWHRGVIGILASRVVDRTRRPAIVISSQDAEAHGSGRSIEGFHLLEALTFAHAAPEPLFSRFGGHAHAVGFSLPLSSLDVLRDRIRTHSLARLTPDLLAPCLAADLELDFSDITPDLLAWIACCAPFGMGNPEPVFVSRALELAAAPRPIKDRHLCLQLRTAHRPQCNPLSAMGWSRAGSIPWTERARIDNLEVGSVIDVMYRLRHNQHPTYGGIELELIDFARPQA
jgi:single-stranded-DNA-specific exonuclease